MLYQNCLDESSFLSTGRRCTPLLVREYLALVGTVRQVKGDECVKETDTGGAVEFGGSSTCDGDSRNSSPAVDRL